MSSVETRLRARALSLLSRRGKTVTITIPASETYVPTTGGVTLGANQPYSVKATPPEPYESRYVNGDTIHADDMRIFIAAKDLEFTPAKGQTVTIDTLKWRIVKVSPVYSGELVALYELQLRR